MQDDFISIFWAWNSDLTKIDFRKQIVDFKEKGINNLFVHARAGLKSPYMGDIWMRSFKKCCEIAKEVGVHIWIYDENGWPSGFGGGIVYETNPSFKERYLLNIYDYKDNLNKSYKIIKVFDDKYNEIDQSNIKSGKKYNFVCLATNDYYVDITNKDAIKCFLDTTHEVYKKYVGEYFGNVIPGVFTDEPHLSPDGLQFAPHIEAEYERRYGEKVMDILKNLFFDIDGCSIYRYRYRKLLAELVRDNYTIQYKKWCEDNNLILSGHYTCEEGLFDQVPTSGRLTSLYENMGLIGVDALGNRLVPLPTFRRSLSSSFQSGKKEVLVETYAGTGYDASFNELLRIWAYEAINGVTHPCLSISMQSLEGNRKRDYPQFFSHQMPWWDNAKVFFDEMKFIKESIHGGRHQDILLIEPISSIELSNRELSLAVTSSFRVLNESLYYSQLDFDYGDEERVKDAKITDGKIEIGECKYGKIILPFSTNIESKVLNKLKEFSNAGGEVYIVTPLPEYLDGKKANIDFDFKYMPIMNRLNYIRKLSEVYNWHDTVIQEKYTRKTHTRLSTSYRYEDDKEFIFVLNQDRNERTEGRIVSKGPKKVTKKTFNETIELEGTHNPFENVSEFYIDLKEMEYALFIVEDGMPKERKFRNTVCSTLMPLSIEKGLNSLVIDQASISINGSTFDEKDYCIRKTSAFFKSVNGDGASILKAKYEFNIEDMPNILYANGEYSDSKVFVNGILVNDRECSFYDEAKRINIIDYVKVGQNEIIIEKRNEPYHNPNLNKDVYQSVFNVFSFPYYVESLILDGDFKVKSNNSVNLFNYYLSDGDFSLMKDDSIINHDLTTSGYPFYRGMIKTLYNYEYDLCGDVYLEIDNTQAISNNLLINGHSIFIYSSRRVNITKYLKKGINDIYLIEYTGLRNTFGPFHHKYGKHYYTGPSVFEGYSEWQDFVIYPELKGNTYVKEYSFTHLYIPNIKIHKEV